MSETKTKSKNLMLRKRGHYDELYTPTYAIYPVIPYMKKGSTVLCPFDTPESNYVKILQQEGFNVIHSHQWEDNDFFDYTKESVKDIDYIVSNPPYSTKDKVLEKLYELDKPFAMLLPIVTLEGIKRSTLFNEYGVEVLVLNRRVNFLEGKGKSSYFNTSYFCHNFLNDKLVFHDLDLSK